MREVLRPPFVISFIESVLLAGESTHLVGPGDLEIGLNLTTVVLVGGAWIFIFSVALSEVGTFHLAFNTDALPLSSSGHVASARPASINVVALQTARGPLDSSNRFHEWCSWRHFALLY